MRSCLRRDVLPRSSSTADFGSPKVWASQACSARLALPSTGGACRRTRKAPSCRPWICVGYHLHVNQHGAIFLQMQKGQGGQLDRHGGMKKPAAFAGNGLEA